MRKTWVKKLVIDCNLFQVPRCGERGPERETGAGAARGSGATEADAHLGQSRPNARQGGQATA